MGDMLPLEAHLWILLLALALDLGLGGAGLLPSASRLAGAMGRALRARLLRTGRKDLAFRGGFTLAAVMGLALGAGALLAHWADGTENRYLPALLHIAVLASVIRLGAPLRAARKLAAALGRQDLEGANAALAGLHADGAAKDLPGAIRLGIEGLSVGLCRGLVGPALAWALTGLPGALAYGAATGLHEALASPLPERARFAAPARALCWLMDFIPARLAALLLALAAAPAPTTHALPALAGLGRLVAGAALDNRVWTARAMAGALAVTLGGPRLRDGQTVDPGWIGDGTAKPERVALKRATVLLGFAVGLVGLFALAGAARLWIG